MSEQSTPTLDRAKVAQMTGWELMEAVGILDPAYRSWRNNDRRAYQDASKTWTVYSTSGRGKRSGTTYVHLYTEGQVKIVDSFGTDTGIRQPSVFHYRGSASAQVGTYRSID